MQNTVISTDYKIIVFEIFKEIKGIIEQGKN